MIRGSALANPSPAKLGRVNYETPSLFDQTVVSDKVVNIDDEIKKNELMIKQKMNKLHAGSAASAASNLPGSMNKIISNTTIN